MPFFTGIRSEYHFRQGTKKFNSYVDDLDPLSPMLLEAVGSFQKAVKLRPEFAAAWFSLGFCYYRCGMVGTMYPYELKSERQYETLESVATESFVSFDLAASASTDGLILLSDEDIQGRAIGYHLRGKALVRLGKFSDALNDINIALDCDPSMTNASHNKSVVESLMEGKGTALGAALL